MTNGTFNYAEASTVKVYGSELYIEVYGLLLECVGQAGYFKRGTPGARAQGPSRAHVPLDADPHLRRRHQRDSTRHHRDRRPRHAASPALSASANEEQHDELRPLARTERPAGPRREDLHRPRPHRPAARLRGPARLARREAVVRAGEVVLARRRHPRRVRRRRHGHRRALRPPRGSGAPPRARPSSADARARRAADRRVRHRRAEARDAARRRERQEHSDRRAGRRRPARSARAGDSRAAQRLRVEARRREGVRPHRVAGVAHSDSGAYRRRQDGSVHRRARSDRRLVRATGNDHGRARVSRDARRPSRSPTAQSSATASATRRFSRG